MWAAIGGAGRGTPRATSGTAGGELLGEAEEVVDVEGGGRGGRVAVGVGVAGGRWGYGGGRWGYGGRRWGYGAAALTGAALYGAATYGYGYGYPYGYSGLYSYSPGYICQY